MENPLKKLMDKKGWTYSDVVIAADVCESTIYKNLQGSLSEPSNKILNLVDKLDYDPELFKKQYKSFKDNKKNQLLN